VTWVAEREILVRRLEDISHDSIQWSTLLDESPKSLGTILCAVGAMSQNPIQCSEGRIMLEGCSHENVAK
jgi:hypothetical protein